MKRFTLIPFLLCFTLLSAQQIEGSWQLIEKDGEKVTDKETVRIYQDGYFASGTREQGSNNFVKAAGGEFNLENGNYSHTYDFHTEKPDLVGEQKQYGVEVRGEQLTLTGPGEDRQVWQKISDRDDDLNRNWVITGRMRNGEIRRSTPGARRTIKILGGGRFQWVAFNSDTKEFHGTGGGTYNAENGKYTENIEFFSRDDSRVGASLQFDYEVKDGEWHHSGKSSKGDPIYEIWSPYEDAYERNKN